MKTWKYSRQYLAELFLVREMFETKVVEKIKKNYVWNICR
jgi:hypothetical protein